MDLLATSGLVLMGDEVSLKKIGTVQSCYPDKFGTPRQPGLVPSSSARIQIDREWQPEAALDGLSDFSHLWVIFEFHQNTNKTYHAKVHPPRLGGKQMGVFATRSPHRPNSLGLSLVKIEKVEGDSIWISGIDLVDGTPVFDIKPYLPEVESIPQASSGWTSQTMDKEISIEWSEEQLILVSGWSEKIQKPRLRALIEETLGLDPRPLIYRGYEGQSSPYRETHAVRIYNGDIHFLFRNPHIIEIKKIVIGPLV